MKKVILLFFMATCHIAISQEIFLLNNMILLEGNHEKIIFDNGIPLGWKSKTTKNDTIIYPKNWKVKKDIDGKYITFSNFSKPAKNEKVGYYYSFHFKLTDKLVYKDSIPNPKLNFDFDNNAIIYKEKNEQIIKEIRQKEWELIYQNAKKKIYKHKKRPDYLFTSMAIKNYELVVQFVFNYENTTHHYPLPDKFTSKELAQILRDNQIKVKKTLQKEKNKAMKEVLKQLILIAMGQNTITNREYTSKKTPYKLYEVDLNN